MTILALDFDGVICNGSREVFVVGLQTYIDLVPDSALAGHLATIDAARSLTAYDFANDGLFARYQRLTPLGNRAEDFGVALRSLEQQVELPDQTAYDTYFARLAGQDRGWLDRYHRQFYRRRAELRSGSTQAWLALQPPYHRFVELLRRRAGDATLAIVTAKDRQTVRALLEQYDLGHLFPAERLLDKEVGIAKTAHLRELARRLTIEPSRITFVDDKVNHLQAAAPLGARCVLAGWGLNSQREHRQAAALGYEVATLDTAETVLFDRGRLETAPP